MEPAGTPLLRDAHVDDRQEVKIDIMEAGQTRVPLSRFGVAAPGEVMDHICSFLDARSLLHILEGAGAGAKSHKGLQAVCRAAGARALWRQKLREDYPNAVEQHLLGRLQPKGCYLQQRLEWVEEQEREKARLERLRQQEMQQAAHRERQQLYKKFSAWFHCYQESFLTGIFVPLLIIFLVLCIVRLSSGDAPTLGDTAPLLALLAAMSVGICCMCYVHYAEAPVPFDDRAFHDSDGLIHHIMYKMGDENKTTHASSCLMLAGFAASVVLCCLRISNVLSSPWYVVFAPLYGTLFLLCFIPWLWKDWIRRDDRRFKVCGAVWALFALPVLIVVLLLNLRLDGVHETPVAAMLTPFWVWDFCTLCVALFVAWDDETPAPLLVWFCGLGPMVTFQGMLVAWDIGTVTSWPLLFIPLYTYLLGFCVMGCWASWKLADDRWG